MLIVAGLAAALTIGRLKQIITRKDDWIAIITQNRLLHDENVFPRQISLIDRSKIMDLQLVGNNMTIELQGRSKPLNIVFPDEAEAIAFFKSEGWPTYEEEGVAFWVGFLLDCIQYAFNILVVTLAVFLAWTFWPPAVSEVFCAYLLFISSGVELARTAALSFKLPIEQLIDLIWQ